MKPTAIFSVRTRPTWFLFGLIALSSTAVMGFTEDTSGPVKALEVNSPLSIQSRLATLATLDFTQSQYEARLADGRLATLYSDLAREQQWAQSLRPFVGNKSPATSAGSQLQKLTTDIRAFHQSYTRQQNLGDQAVYDNPDAIVILGAGRKVLEQRLMFALPLIHKFPNIPVILSGGGRTLELEAQVMQDFLTAKGVDAERLIQETDSLDTVGNAVFTALTLTKHKVPGNKVLIITSDFHAPRSLFLFQAIFDSRYRLAVALAPSEVSDRSALINGELTQQATSMRDLLNWSLLPGREGLSVQPVAGTCGVFFQTLLHHNLYKARWDLSRRYADICNMNS